MKSLLVTGGSGFIGSAFIRWVLQKTPFSGSITNLDLLTYAAIPSNLESVARDSRYAFVQGDILDPALVEHLLKKGVDTVVHFAAETHVDRSIESSFPFIETNVKGTLTLLEALRKFPQVHFHHVSTDEVYGSLEEEGVFNERSAYAPNSPYAASKAASDHLVRAFAHTYGLKTTMSHCSNNYGPGQYPEKLIPLVLQKCLTNQPIPIYGKGTNVRDWLYVEDHVEAIWKILESGKVGETYGIGGGTEVSNREVVHRLIDLLAQKTGRDTREYLSLIEEVKDRPGHDFRYAIDASKIQKELGWMPRTSFAEGLAKTIDCQVFP